MTSSASRWGSVLATRAMGTLPFSGGGFLILRLRRPDLRDRLARQQVGALVLRMTGMTAQPVPANLMLVHRRIEPLPQVDVFDRFFVRRAPAVLFPSRQIG